VTYRTTSTNDYYPTSSDQTSHTYIPPSDKDDSYLIPTTKNNPQRTIAGNISEERIPLVKQNNSPRSTTESNIPRVGIKDRAPTRPAPPPPPTKRDDSGDSYV
jgi:hypothetical protein